MKKYSTVNPLLFQFDCMQPESESEKIVFNIGKKALLFVWLQLNQTSLNDAFKSLGPQSFIFNEETTSGMAA